MAGQLCALCGLDAGGNPLENEGRSYCCPGCLNVHAILIESGAVALGADPRDTELFRRSFDDGLVSRPGTEAATRPAETSEEAELALHVEGMWCASCAWLIERSLEKLPGVTHAEAFFSSDLVKVRYQPKLLPPSRIRERIERLGYRASNPDGAASSAPSRSRDLVMRLGVAAFLWLNVMTLSMIFYVGYFEPVAPAAHRYVPLLLAVLTAPAVFYSAWPVIRAAALGLREGVLRMETLLALGILAAYGYSSALAFAGGKHYYFDTACAIITFVLAGKLIESGAKERTRRAVSLLHRMMPRKARLITGSLERERFVPVDRLRVGDQFFVRSGERIPADGVIVSGSSDVDESIITGEAVPAARRRGDEVNGGSLNLSGPLTVAASSDGGHGLLRSMVESVERALASRARIERTVDRASRIFVPVVIVVAAVSWFVWRSDPGSAIVNSISVLVIACPCALGIATPLAVSSAVAAASRRGVLVTHAEALENAAGIDMVVFDKTGTLTEGRFEVAGFAGDGADEAEVLGRIAPVEAGSEHPLARAIVERARELGVASAVLGSLERIDGEGVRSEYAFAGNEALAERECDAPVPGVLTAAAANWRASGLTVIYGGWDGRTRAAIALGDRIREGAREAVARIQSSGRSVVLLSGDAEATTRAAAEALGIREYFAGVRPARKHDLVLEWQASGRRVAMVGDGINDAPALARATLGIAMGSGAALAMEAAHVVLVRPSLELIPATFDLAHRTMRTVRRNLFWAFFYNAAGITAAVMGVLNPLLAAGAMILSSLSVTVQSARLERWGPAGVDRGGA